MTFKHIDFESSPVMRSLERIANKNNPIVKNASVKKIDLTPTDDLMLNIIKLCDGLRSVNLIKYAEELEDKFLNYKRANTLYDISGEKGEDLVDAAHPDGSHQLEGVEGDGLVETIIDKHLKMLQMIDKKPLGKSSSSLDIIKAVKVVLADTTLEPVNLVGNKVPDLPWELKDLVANAQTEVNDAINNARPQVTLPLHFFETEIRASLNNPTIYNLNQALKTVSDLLYRLEPGIVFGMEDRNSYDQVVKPSLLRAISFIKRAIPIRIQYEQQVNQWKDRQSQSEPSTTQPANSDVGNKIQELNVKFDSLISKLPSWKTVVSGKSYSDKTLNAKLMKWIDNADAKIAKAKSDFAAHLNADPTDQDKENTIAKYNDILNKLSDQANSVYNQYIRA